MMAKPVAYRYEIAAPRLWDVPRPDWPRDLVDRIEAIPGVVGVTFGDLTGAWRPCGEAGERRESRQRVVWVTTSHVKQDAADVARDRLAAVARDLDAVGVVRWSVELL